MLIQGSSESDSAKAQIATFPLQEPEGTQSHAILAQNVFVRVQLASANGTLSAPVELPQASVVALYEADVVQVDVILGIRCGSVALRSRFLVGVGKGGSGFEKSCALQRIERDRLLDEFV